MSSLIDYSHLENIQSELKEQWNDPSKPFRYLVFDGFFEEESAQKIYDAYPKIGHQDWDYTTYVNQKNKFVMTEFENHPVIKQVFEEINGKKLLQIVEQITGIENIEPDPKLFGGGLHQSVKGAFLDVHVDFNYHPETNYHRRMNILVYMNKDWKEEYEGYLELWDMDTKGRIENLSPDFNRCVIFETNEISFHGHPHHLNTPEGIARQSIAAYYYTQTRPEEEIAQDHNTIYVNVEGMKGKVKNFKSGVKALLERINKK